MVVVVVVVVVVGGGLVVGKFVSTDFHFRDFGLKYQHQIYKCATFGR